MRQFDLAPLYRSTVGFDRLFSALDQFASAEAAPTYPPYNIERTGENAYRITAPGMRNRMPGCRPLAATPVSGSTPAQNQRVRPLCGWPHCAHR